MLKIKSLIKNYGKQIAVCGFFLCIFCIYYFIDPSKSAFFLRCPLNLVTGYECAGCGVQRAFHELLHFRFLQAFKYNPLFVVAIPILLIIIILRFFKSNKNTVALNRMISSRTFVILVLVIVFVFSLLKNTDYYRDLISAL